MNVPQHHSEKNVSTVQQHYVLQHSIEPVNQRDVGNSNSDTHTDTHRHAGVVVPVKQANYNHDIMALMNVWKNLIIWSKNAPCWGSTAALQLCVLAWFKAGGGVNDTSLRQLSHCVHDDGGQ